MLSYGADPSPNVAAALRRLTRSLSLPVSIACDESARFHSRSDLQWKEVRLLVMKTWCDFCIESNDDDFAFLLT
jgi:hypothetical protein